MTFVPYIFLEAMTLTLDFTLYIFTNIVKNIFRKVPYNF